MNNEFNVKNMIIGITGSAGLLGKHMCMYLSDQNLTNIKYADRTIINNDNLFCDFINQSDCIIHFAGVNRGEESDIYNVNIELAERIITKLNSKKDPTYLLFSSSTQINRDNIYAASKRKCSELFESWSSSTDNQFCNLVIPNVFGEWGKPYYNSVVATFCKKIVENQETKIIDDIEIELIYAQNLSAQIYEIIKKYITGNVKINGDHITISELRDQLITYNTNYSDVNPALLTGTHSMNLFKTLSSYKYPDNFPMYNCLDNGVGKILEIKAQSEYSGVCGTSMVRIQIINGSLTLSVTSPLTQSLNTFDMDEIYKQYVDLPIYHLFKLKNVSDNSAAFKIITFNEVEK